MNKLNCNIRLETPNDHKTVENLTREAFWNVNVPGCSEHYLVHIMRQHGDFIPELAFVLEYEGEIVANIMYSKAHLIDEKGEKRPILTFGPLSVDPRHQRKGIGKMLMEHSFDKARELGHDIIVIFGSPPNYVTSGFVSAQKHNICLEGDFCPVSLLVKQLVPDALDGRKYYFAESEMYALCTDEAAENFDKAFPPKEKAWQPSQEEFYINSHSRMV